MDEKFYYTFPVNSKLGKAFMDFCKECHKADQKADRYARRMGALFYYSEPSAFAGGVSTLCFDEKGDAGGKHPRRSVDDRVWRYVTTINGDKCYEPNCRQVMGCSMVDTRFVPSDTMTMVWQKSVSPWAQVKHLYSRAKWAELAGIALTGDAGNDDKLLDAALGDKQFRQYMLFTGDDLKPVPKKGRSLPLMRAIKAERERMALPVVTLEPLAKLLEFDMEGHQPDNSTFGSFIYRDYFYISVSCRCDADGLEPIPALRYNYQLDTMKFVAAHNVYDDYQ